MATTIQNLPGEIWKPVVGREGFYAVSNLGRVKACARTRQCADYMHCRLGTTTHHKGAVQRQKERLLKHLVRHKGYLSVGLKAPQPRALGLVHRLVLEAFVGPCPEGMECCHNDGNPANNRLENLRWDSPLANNHDRARHGTLPRGSIIAWAKLNEAVVRSMREEAARGALHRELAAKHGVAKATATRAIRGLSWKHV